MAKLSEALKNTTSITEVSKALDCSRPTLYKYIELYEHGDFEQIPPKVRTYFDSVMNEDISRAESEAYLKSIMIEREKLDYELTKLTEKRKNLCDKLAAVQSSEEANSPEANKLREELDYTTKKLNVIENNIVSLSSKMHAQAASIEKTIMDSRESGPAWTDSDVRHVCSGTNGNFVIIYEKPDLDATVYIELYARIAGNDEYMGRYVPEQGKNFVQIAGLPNTLTYLYKIVLIDEEGKHTTEHMKLNTR